MGNKNAQLSVAKGLLSPRAKSKQRKSKLSELDYYHYYLPREEVEWMLKESGDFLIRESVMPDKRAAIVLSLKTNRDVKHIPAEYNLEDKNFYFENVGKPSMKELVEHHVTKKIAVGGTFMKKPIGRSRWQILDNQIDFLENAVLGEGNFAVVTRGKLRRNNKMVDVACKKLKVERCKTKFEKDKAKFAILREFQIGRALHGHHKILTVHGIYVGTEELAVIMELCDGGALDKYMMNNPTPVYEKISYLAHAASGLSYMHRLNLIHRDVASRNFLVVKRDKDKLLPLIKVSDFGLTRQGPVYRMSTDHEVPFLISALECLGNDPLWTLKSDCWSFGVLVWHVFDDCKTDPYHEDTLAVDSTQLREQLLKGHRLNAQSTMPKELKTLMMDCFEAAPEKRPTMTEIQSRLFVILVAVWNEANA